MKEYNYYKAIEYFKWDEHEGSIALTYPKGSKNEYSSKFETYEDAEEAVRLAVYQRKTQYTYYRDQDGNLIKKVSYYDQHELKYKIFKVKEVRELLYEEDNKDIELIEVDKNLQAETPLTL